MTGALLHLRLGQRAGRRRHSWSSVLRDWRGVGKSEVCSSRWICLLLESASHLSSKNGPRDVGQTHTHLTCAHNPCPHKPQKNKMSAELKGTQIQQTHIQQRSKAPLIHGSPTVKMPPRFHRFNSCKYMKRTCRRHTAR